MYFNADRTKRWNEVNKPDRNGSPNEARIRAIVDSRATVYSSTSLAFLKNLTEYT